MIIKDRMFFMLLDDKLDLGIVFGGKNTKNEFAVEKDFVQKLLEKKVISTDATNVGLLYYGNWKYFDYKIADYLVKTKLMQLVNPRNIEATIEDVLENARLIFFKDKTANTEIGSRYGSFKTLVVFINSELSSIAKRELLLMKEEGVHVIIVAIGQVDNLEDMKYLIKRNSDFIHLNDSLLIHQLANDAADNLVLGEISKYLLKKINSNTKVCVI